MRCEKDAQYPPIDIIIIQSDPIKADSLIIMRPVDIFQQQRIVEAKKYQYVQSIMSGSLCSNIVLSTHC